MWVSSSELKSENNKVSGYGGLYVINQVILNYGKFWVFEEPYLYTFYVVWDAPYLYLYLEHIKTYSGKEKKIEKEGKIRRRLILILCMVIPSFQLPTKHVSHDYIYC